MIKLRLFTQPVKSLFTLFVLLTLATPNLLMATENNWQGVERIVAIGDIHGDYDNFLLVLKEAGLVNRRGNWIGGVTHLVQLGDIPDRGPDTDKIIKLLKKLETQAIDDGGMVHALIGNHEAMNMLGDLRYVHPGEYAALKDSRSKSLQDRYYQQFVEYQQNTENPPLIDAAHRQAWNQQYPLGYVEHRIHWAAEGEFGSWVLQHNSVIRINNILFLHGGLGPAMLQYSLDQLNEQIHAELTTQDDTAALLVDNEEGPLWYRGLALAPEAEERAHVLNLLQHFDVDHIVVGHTPGYGGIIPRFDGSVLLTDSGISDYYGGHRASLLVEGGKFVALQQGKQIPLPGTGEPVLDYLEQIYVLEPDVNNLGQLIENLKAGNELPVTPLMNAD